MPCSGESVSGEYILNKFFLPQLLAATLLCGSALAEEVSSSGTKIENIVVTGARSPVTQAEIGSSVTVVDREFIENRQSIFVLDVLRDVPGIQVSRSGGNGKQTQLRIRGAESNQVLVMIDGIKVVDPAAADEFQWENLTTADVERIEVVRGPQSAIWGGEALAGVINIITVKDKSGMSASGYAEGGSFGTANAGARIGGGGNTWTGGVGVSYLDTDGENIARTGSEKDGYDNTTLSLNGGWNPSADLKIGLVGRYTDASTYTDATDFVTTGLPADPVPLSADARREDSNQLYAGLTGDLATFSGRWNHNLRLNRTATDRDVFVDSGDKSANNVGETTAVYYVSSIGLAGPIASESPTLNLAVDWKRDDYEYRCFNADGVDCTTFGDPNQDQKMANTGYVAELLSGEWGGFSATGSLRYDDNSDFDNVTTYRFTAGYLLAADTRVRGAIGTGWKAPTFTERYGFFPGDFIGNPDLKPETSEGWEVGVDQALLGGDLNLGATYFNEHLEDEINGFIFDANAGAFTAENLDGTSKRKGVELLADTNIGPNVTLLLNYTYLDAKQPSVVEPDGDETELRRPRHSAAFNGNFRFWNQRANANLNISYVGDRKDIYFPPFPDPSQIVDLDAYALVNLSAAYRFNDSIEIYGRIENLLDEEYEDVFGYNTLGVGGVLGVRVSFTR